jgi:2-dehydro-3-deoxygalactonokinase
MLNRPATEPGDPAGFEMGLEAAMRNGGETGEERVGLLHLLFGARAAVVSGRMNPSLLGPYISGLLTGDEINGALNQFSRLSAVTIVADSPRADLYVEALNRRRIATAVKSPQDALIAGLALIARHRATG